MCIVACTQLEGYPLKERNEPYFTGAILGSSAQTAASAAVQWEEKAIRTRYGGKKLTCGKAGGRTDIERKTMFRLCAAQEMRDGTYKLQMLPCTG